MSSARVQENVGGDESSDRDVEGQSLDDLGADMESFKGMRRTKETNKEALAGMSSCDRRFFEASEQCGRPFAGDSASDQGSTAAPPHGATEADDGASSRAASVADDDGATQVLSAAGASGSSPAALALPFAARQKENFTEAQEAAILDTLNAGGIAGG